jgi:hypothetical protein
MQLVLINGNRGEPAKLEASYSCIAYAFAASGVRLSLRALTRSSQLTVGIVFSFVKMRHLDVECIARLRLT